LCLDVVYLANSPLAKLVKDVAAGAVLLVALTAVVVGLLVLGPPLWVQLGFMAVS